MNWSNHLTAPRLERRSSGKRFLSMASWKKEKKKGAGVNQVIVRRSRLPISSDPSKNLEPENEILLKPIRRGRLYENAVDQIQTLILRKKYTPGDRLPSERSLAQQFHISRHSLREALRILDVMGLIEIKVGDGIYVKEINFLPYIESVNLSISSRLQMERDSFIKLWEVRKILEVGMVDLSSRQITQPFLKSLWRCIEEMEKNIG